MLASCFPDSLSVGLSTAAHKTGNKSDMSNYKGIPLNPVIAKLFAMMLEQRIAKWADKRGVKAWGQAGFQQMIRLLTTFKSCEPCLTGKGI